MKITIGQLYTSKTPSADIMFEVTAVEGDIIKYKLSGRIKDYHGEVRIGVFKSQTTLANKFFKKLHGIKETL